MTWKTFTCVFNSGKGTIVLDQDVNASVITLKLYSIIAFDVAGAATTPRMSINFRQISSSVNDNSTTASGIVIHTDVSKIHTIVPCDITMSLGAPLGRAFEYTLTHFTSGNVVDFSSNIVNVALTFNYNDETGMNV